MLRDGLRITFFWDDTSDEVIRHDMTAEGAFEPAQPLPVWLVHAYSVTSSPEDGFNPPHQALCGFEVGANLRLTSARQHPLGPCRECGVCCAIVHREWGEDASSRG